MWKKLAALSIAMLAIGIAVRSHAAGQSDVKSVIGAIQQKLDGVKDYSMIVYIRQGGGEFKYLKGTKWGFFVQDNWRATRNLTLNLGVRWDPYLPYYDREGRVICVARIESCGKARTTALARIVAAAALPLWR